jgi:HEPN domain-containing protein
MNNRAKDWRAETERDLAQARDSERARGCAWACFAATVRVEAVRV